MRKFGIGILLAILILVLLLSGCEPKPGETPEDRTEQHVLLVGNQMAPKELSLRAGEKVRWFISNGTNDKHTFTNDVIGLNVEVEGNKTESKDWTVPTQLGDYLLNSVINGQKEKDITMLLHVVDKNAQNLKQNQEDLKNIAPEKKN